jgi:hypothetical protein
VNAWTADVQALPNAKGCLHMPARGLKQLSSALIIRRSLRPNMTMRA